MVAVMKFGLHFALPPPSVTVSFQSICGGTEERTECTGVW